MWLLFITARLEPFNNPTTKNLGWRQNSKWNVSISWDEIGLPNCYTRIQILFLIETCRSVWFNGFLIKFSPDLDVRGCVHHSTIHKENPKKCKNVSKFCYSIFIWSSTCFGRHTAHNQEPKTALAASGFSHLEGCWTCSWWTDTPPIIRSLKLHWQPLVFHTWKVVGRVVGGQIHRPSSGA